MLQGGMSIVAHHAAIRRMEQAGAVSALQVLLEFQRDWARNEHYDEVARAVKLHCNLFGLGWENVGTEVFKRVSLPRQNLPPQI
jgi:hypothetical protein